MIIKIFNKEGRFDYNGRSTLEIDSIGIDSCYNRVMKERTICPLF